MKIDWDMILFRAYESISTRSFQKNYILDKKTMKCNYRGCNIQLVAKNISRNFQKSDYNDGSGFRK